MALMLPLWRETMQNVDCVCLNANFCVYVWCSRGRLAIGSHKRHNLAAWSSRQDAQPCLYSSSSSSNSAAWGPACTGAGDSPNQAYAKMSKSSAASVLRSREAKGNQ